MGSKHLHCKFSSIFNSQGGIKILLFIYAPALIYIFPQIPEWIGRIFPTYYQLTPIVAISQKDVKWPDIASDVYVLIGIILALLFIVFLAARRAEEHEV